MLSYRFSDFSAPMDVGRRPKTIAIEENLWNPLGTRLFNIDRGPVPSGLDVADAGTPIGSFTPCNITTTIKVMY